MWKHFQYPVNQLGKFGLLVGTTVTGRRPCTSSTKTTCLSWGRFIVRFQNGWPSHIHKRVAAPRESSRNVWASKLHLTRFKLAAPFPTIYFIVTIEWEINRKLFSEHVKWCIRPFTTEQLRVSIKCLSLILTISRIVRRKEKDVIISSSQFSVNHSQDWFKQSDWMSLSTSLKARLGRTFQRVANWILFGLHGQTIFIPLHLSLKSDFTWSRQLLLTLTTRWVQSSSHTHTQSLLCLINYYFWFRCADHVGKVSNMSWNALRTVCSTWCIGVGAFAWVRADVRSGYD